MLKKLPSKAKTKPKTPTTKNGKFVITFNVFGTPVEVKIMMKQSKQNKTKTKTYSLQIFTLQIH
jgi:hypothetical protein